MKKIFLLTFGVFVFGCLLVFSLVSYAESKLFQDFTQESLDILGKTYKYELKEEKNVASFSEILEYFPHLKLKDNYDIKYFTFRDRAGRIPKMYAVENGSHIITNEEWRMNPEVRDKLLSPIAAIQITENTAQAKQELAIFQMVINTLFWSNRILFLDNHKKELLESEDKRALVFSLEEKRMIEKAYETPSYEETPNGFKVKFLRFYDSGSASLSYITYKFIQDEKGTWKLQKEEKEVLFSQPRRYRI